MRVIKSLAAATAACTLSLSLANVPAAANQTPAESVLGASSALTPRANDGDSPLTGNEFDQKQKQAAANKASQAAKYAAAEDVLTLAQKATAGSSSRAVQVIGLTLGNAVKGLTAASKSGATVGVITFGFDELISLLFPPKQSTAQDIKELSVEMATDFNDVQASIAELGTQMEAVGKEAKAAASFAANGACETALKAADANVSRINTYATNYSGVFENSWWSKNIGSKATSPQEAQKAVYDQVFNANAGLTPADLQQNVDDLVTGLTTSGLGENNSLIALCADELIAGAASNFNGGPNSVVPVGAIEDQVFPVLQQLVTRYATVANAGQSISATMQQIAAGKDVDPSQTPLPCSENTSDASCKKIAQDVKRTQEGVARAYRLAGASWSQLTNNAIATNLRSSQDTLLAGGDTAWVLDIAAYGNSYGFFPPADSEVNSASAATGPAAGVTSMANDTWEGLTFKPATAKQWNSLLRTEYGTLPGEGNQTPETLSNNNECLPGQSSPLASFTQDCTYPSTTGELMAAAGLLNGAAPVGENLIVYTGESANWSYTDAAWYLGVPLQWKGDKFPAGLASQGVESMSFLDTSITPNSAASVVVNDPAGLQGTWTTSSLFPFALYNQYGQKNGAYNTNWELTNEFDSSASGTFFAQVACKDGGGSTSGITNPTLFQTPWTMNRFQLNSDLYCGVYKYTPPSSQGGGIALTQNPLFYDNPSLNLSGYVWAEDEKRPGNPFDAGVYVCTESNIGEFPSTYLNSGECPPLWESYPGYFTGANPDGGRFDTQAQYLWPVINLPAAGSSAELSPLGNSPQWATPTQGSGGSTPMPVLDRKLFQDFLATNVSVPSGPVTAQVPTGVKLVGEPDAAHVLLFNDSGASVPVNVEFVLNKGGTFTAAPTSPSFTNDPYSTADNMVCTEIPGTEGYDCSMSVPPGAPTLLTLPVKVTGAKNSGGFSSASLTILGSGGTVGADLGGKVSGSFGGVYDIDTDLSQFDEEMIDEVDGADYGAVYDLRAALVDTPSSEIGKKQSQTTGMKASPYGVKLLGGYKPGTVGLSASDVDFEITGTVSGKKSSVSQVPACPGLGCFTVSGTVGDTSKDGTADVTLTIQSGDPRPSTVSVRSGPNTILASAAPTQVATGDVVTLKLKDLPVGVHDLTVWGTSDKTPFQVVVAPAKGAQAFTFTHPNPNPVIYLPTDGDWSFTVTPQVNQRVRSTMKSLTFDASSSELVDARTGNSFSYTVTPDLANEQLRVNVDTGTMAAPYAELQYSVADASGKNVASGSASAGNRNGRDGYETNWDFRLSVASLDAGTYDADFGFEYNDDYAPSTFSGSGTVTVTWDTKTDTHTGGSDDVSITVGPDKATAPTELVATTNSVTGEITLTWEPVVVVPAIDEYVMVATPPNGGTPFRKTLDASSTSATFTPTTLGPWNVSLTASNSLGRSPAATRTVVVKSAVPPKPDNVDVTISPTGVVTGSWTSVASKPQVTGYHVGLYSPSGQRVYEENIPVTPRADQGVMRFPEFFALGKNSVPGEWTFTVAADNADGRGPSARGSLLIPQAAIERMERLVQSEKFLLAAEVTELIGLDRIECERGLVSGTLPTGKCDGNIFTPSAAFLGVLADPGTSVTAQYCAGTSAKKTLDSCADVEGVVMNGTVEMLFTHSTLPAGQSEKFAVWAAGKKIWETPDPVPAGATTTAAFPAPTATATYVVTVGTNAPPESVSTVVEVAVPTTDPSTVPETNPAAPAAPSSVQVTGCTAAAASCPTVSGSRSGASASLTVKLAAPTTELTVVDTTTGVTMFDASGQSFAAQQSIPIQLTGLSRPVESLVLTTSSGSTYLTVR